LTPGRGKRPEGEPVPHATDGTTPRGLRLALLVAESLLWGAPPPEPRRRTRRPPRAPRVRLDRVVVEAESVSWHTRRRSGVVPREPIDRVAVLEVEYESTSGPGMVRRHALVLDADDVVLLRVSAGPTGGPRGVEAWHRLQDVWAPLGVPVHRESVGTGRPHDVRRRWPEAFGFVASRPYWTAAISCATYLLVVVPILDRVLGP